MGSCTGRPMVGDRRALNRWRNAIVGASALAVAGLSVGVATPSAGAGTAYAAVSWLSQADGAVATVASAHGVYLTTDEGRRWLTVAPPDLGKGKSPAEQITSMVAIGTDDLWLPVHTVTGLPPSTPATDAGSTRGKGIERSTDGGGTWTLTPLPGCNREACGPVALSFVDARDGFALAASGGSSSELFATVDGCTTWHTAGEAPFGGGDTELGGGPRLAIAFTSTADGGAVAGLSPGGDATAAGRLYRTSDGGLTWTRASGLPATDRYEVPTFFGAADGVVVGAPAAGARRAPCVFVTDDGGATWVRHPLPMRTTDAYSTSTPPDVPFAAVSALDWVVDIGPSVYTTSDGGRRWTRRAASPAVATGSVSAIVFSSTTEGMALGLPPGCPRTAQATGRPGCDEVLTATTDGGRHWSALHL